MDEDKSATRGHLGSSLGSAAQPDPGPPKLTVDVLRAKLDAAIVAEAWDAVKAIRQRIVEVERADAGNIVQLDARACRRRT